MTSNRAEETPQLLAAFTVASEPGNERVALREVAAKVAHWISEPPPPDTNHTNGNGNGTGV